MRTTIACMLSLIVAAGCGGRAPLAKKPATTTPTVSTAPSVSTAPQTTRVAPRAATSAPQGKTFQDAKNAFAVRYPSDWSTRQTPENVLTIDARTGDATGPEISVAVPKLGVHVPGLIPLPAVQSGYVSNLR